MPAGKEWTANRKWKAGRGRTGSKECRASRGCKTLEVGDPGMGSLEREVMMALVYGLKKVGLEMVHWISKISVGLTDLKHYTCVIDISA